MNMKPIRPCSLAVLSVTGFFVAAPIEAQTQIGYPEKMPLTEPIKYCFDQFQRTIANRLSETEGKYVEYVDYTYHLLLDKKEHIGREGDVFVYMIGRSMPEGTWLISLFNGITMAWETETADTAEYPMNIPMANSGGPPAYYSGPLPPMKKVTVTLPAKDAAEWESAAGPDYFFVGYGVRETPEATTADSYRQMGFNAYFKDIYSNGYWEGQLHEIWDKSDKRTYGTSWSPVFNNGSYTVSQICLDINGISYDYPPRMPFFDPFD